MAGSAGVYITVDDDSGTIHRQQLPANVRARVWTGARDHYLAVEAGRLWVLTETQLGGRPARDRKRPAASSRFDGDRYDWPG